VIGKTVSHYKIIEEIGRGGMGEVYLAEDFKLERKVAIKFLPQHLTKDRNNVERFEREAKAAASLNHPNIVTIYEIAEENDQIFIVMEYVEGKSLRDVINEYKMGIEKIIDIITQISEGLSKAHKEGIVHRDIKPENIIIGKDARVKILDFGLAKLKGVSKLTKNSSTVGTIHYMAPEQVQGKDVDHRSDIWSLGIVFYELLAGNVPFKGDYEQAVVYSIQSEDFDPLDNLAPGYSKILQKLLAKEPNDRYQHLEEVIHLIGENKNSERIKGIRKWKKYWIYLLSLIALFVVAYFLTIHIFLDTAKVVTSKWENSIAVLPFIDLSPSKDQEYFCDGMTEQIITNLSKIKRLKVIARTSVMTYKNSDKQIPQIGKELNVSHLLEGSIRKFGDQIRVSAQLVNAYDGSHVWADDFDRKLDNVFKIQDDISQIIASNLLATLSFHEITVIKSKKPKNTEAYDFFLKGSYLLIKYERFRQLSDLKMSEQFFKNAIEKDANYATAYAFLSDVYGTFPFDNPEQNEKYLRLQEHYIQIAYNLDSLSSDILSRKSFFYMRKNEPEQSFTFLKKSLAIGPNHYSSNLQMGIFLRNYGLPNRSIKYFNTAAELNPIDTWVYVARGWAYTNAGEFDKAEFDFQRALEISSNDFWSLLLNVEFLIMMNRLKEAKKLFLKFELSYPTEESVKFCKSLLLARQGDSLKAMKLLEQYKFGGWEKIILYCALGNGEKAIFSLNESLQIQKSSLVNPKSRYMELKHLPWFDNLRSDPRFQEILAKQKEYYEGIVSFLIKTHS
jgi:serine/threonine protein kinase